MSDLILGRHPVHESLTAGTPINKVLFAKNIENKGIVLEIVSLVKKAGIAHEFVDRKALDRIAAGANHQGIIAMAAAQKYAEIEDILAIAHAKNEQPFIILLDGLEDPHNLGAIIRTADAAGAHGVVIPKHRAVGLTATVSKASAGAIAHVPVAKVTNLNECIRKLKEQRVWIFGLSEEGDLDLNKADFKMAMALVVGGEGKGLSQLVARNCDFLVKIDMRGKINSLNASVAAGVAMYEVVRQRKS